MFLHVFYSWLIAQVLHPLVLIFSIWVFNDSSGYVPRSSYFYFVLFSAIASLPCLLLGWLCFGMIVYADYTFEAKFLIWLTTAAILVILNLSIIILVFDNRLEAKDLLIAVPGILSIWIALFIRLKQFHRLNIIENNLSEDQMSFEAGNESLNQNH